MYRSPSIAIAIRAGFLAFAALAVLAVHMPARAQQAGAGGPYVVTGVAVDETAETAIAAREAALLNGQREAARRLFDRLTSGAYSLEAGQPDADTLAGLVDSLRIQNERTSNVRYLAELTVRFRPDAVRAYLGSAGVAFSEGASRPVLIVPVLQRGGSYLLWEDPNPWRAAWANQPRDAGLVPVVTPIGDLTDISGLTAEQAVQADVNAIAEMASRYDAETGVVAIASPSDDEIAAALSMNVTVLRVGRIEEAPVVFEVDRAPDETAEEFLRRSAVATIEALDTDWKSVNTVGDGQVSLLHAAVPVRDLANWIEIRRRLNGVPTVREIRVLSLTPGSVEVEIDHQGDLFQFERALNRFDFVLEETGFQPGFGQPDPTFAPAIPTPTPGVPPGMSPGVPGGAPSPSRVPTHVIRLLGA